MVWTVDHCGPTRSNPWKKGLRPRPQHRLWSEAFWKDLCTVAKMTPQVKFSDTCREMIARANESMYGHR